MRRPTFSIVTDSIENTNLAIREFFEIALEEGWITEEELNYMGEGKKESYPVVRESPAPYGFVETKEVKHMIGVRSISSHKKQYINEASILRLRPFAIEEIGDDESFYLYQKCQTVLYESLNRNDCNEVALVYALGSHEEGNLILGTQTNTDLESDTKTQQLLNQPDGTVCVLVHNHPTDTSFSIEDFMEFLLYGKMKVMVVVTNSGEQYYMIKTKNYDYMTATSRFARIVKSCDHNGDGIMTRSESVQAAKQFEKIAYTLGINIE